MSDTDQNRSASRTGILLVLLVIGLFGIWLVLKAPWSSRSTTKKKKTSERTEEKPGVSEMAKKDGQSGDSEQAIDGASSPDQTDEAEERSRTSGDSPAKRESGGEPGSRETSEPEGQGAGKTPGGDTDTQSHTEKGGTSESEPADTTSAGAPDERQTADRKTDGTTDQDTDRQDTSKEEGKVASVKKEKEETTKKDADTERAKKTAAKRTEKLSAELRSLENEATRLFEEKKYDAAIQRLDRVRERAPSGKKEDLKKTLSRWKEKRRETRKLADIWYEKAVEAKENSNWDRVLDHLEKALSYMPHSERLISLRKKAKRLKKYQGMVRIDGGTYRVGDGAVENHPERTVEIDAFYIERHEVTNGEYATFLEATDHRPPLGWEGTDSPSGKENYPVTGVSFRDAKQYAKWAGKRLPSEAEWEAAARGGDGRSYPWTSSSSGVPANTVENGQKGTVSVTNSSTAGKTPEGVFHMVGNVAEWTTTTATGPEGNTYRIVKGGSFLYPQEKGRAPERLLRSPDARVIGIGFRCVLDAPSEKGE